MKQFNNLYRAAVLLGLVCLLIIAAKGYSSGTHNAPDEREIRARSFLEQYAAPLRDDEFVLTNLLVQKDAVFQTQKMAALLEKNYVPNRPVGRGYGEETFVTASQVKEWMAGSKKSDDGLYHSMYCDIVPFSNNDFNDLMAGRDYAGGYLDTHILLDLTFIKRSHCFDEKKIDTAIDSIANTIALVDFSAPQYDLESERIVFLYWAGKGNLVQKAWIDHILAGQASNGSWVDAKVPTLVVHATTFALLAHLYFAEGIPYQDPYTTLYARP